MSNLPFGVLSETSVQGDKDQDYAVKQAIWRFNWGANLGHTARWGKDLANKVVDKFHQVSPTQGAKVGKLATLPLVVVTEIISGLEWMRHKDDLEVSILVTLHKCTKKYNKTWSNV